MFIKCLQEIFGVSEVDWRGEWMPVSKTFNKHLETQIITCKEFVAERAFSEG
jgi:hypothetical protein